MHGRPAGILSEHGTAYVFHYDPAYSGPPVSLTMPVRAEPYRYSTFPAVFDGLLPEGWQLEGLLRRAKLDRTDQMGQLLVVGGDLVGAVSVEPEGL